MDANVNLQSITKLHTAPGREQMTLALLYSDWITAQFCFHSIMAVLDAQI